MKKRISRRFWTLAKCLEEALKHNSIKDWCNDNESSYKAALDQKIIDQCSAHMKRLPLGSPKKYTLEQCIQIAEKFSSREEWKKKHKASYKCAAGAGWYYECVKNIPNTRAMWNSLEKCRNEALKFKTKRDWRKASPSSYMYAHKKQWIDLCSSHMISPTREGSIEFEIKKLVKSKYYNAESKRFTVKDPQFYAKSFEIDVFIPELNKGIEFDGKYWHSDQALQKRFPTWPIDVVKKYHDLKDEFFKTIGIELLHIKETDWLKNKEAEIQKIYNFIGL